MIHITVESYLAAQAAAVEEKGADYVYPFSLRDEHGSCQYIVNGVPTCIAGATLSKLGVRNADLALIEQNPIGTGLAILKDRGVLTFADDVGAVACEAQVVQDKDTRIPLYAGFDASWGAAHAASLIEAGRLEAL